MRALQILLLVCLPTALAAQSKAVTVSYFGEMMSHPGLKVGIDYSLKTWDKEKAKKGVSKILTKSYQFSPSVGFYYHRRYQTGSFLNAELSRKRQNAKGGFFSYGLNLGYLGTLVPNNFVMDDTGIVERKLGVHYYVWSGLSLMFGKDFSIQHETPFGWFVKPQFMYALPNFPTGVGYFILETGITYKLK